MVLLEIGGCTTVALAQGPATYGGQASSEVIRAGSRYGQHGGAWAAKDLGSSGGAARSA
jgi:hypothetical protein